MNLVASMLVQIRMKFRYLSCVPYLFANACNQWTAREILEQWENQPESQQHRVTRELVHRLKAQLETVAAGGQAGPELRSEQDIFRAFSLNEASIEGYHAEVAKIVARAHAGRPAYTFAEVRFKANIERIQMWSMKQGGDLIIAFEWQRYTRLLRFDRSWRALRVKPQKFRSMFYRLRDDAVGPIDLLMPKWSSRLSPPMPARITAHRLKTDFCASVVKPGLFHSLVTENGDIVVFVLVRQMTGNEKLVDLGHGKDVRDLCVVQAYDIWRRTTDGDQMPTALTVTPTLEPETIMLWQLAGSWSTFRQNLRVWRSRPSDTSGCVDLDYPSEFQFDNADSMCPVIVLLERLRDKGWAPKDRVVAHTLNERTFSIKNVANRREYLQVLLLELASLIVVGTGEPMKSDNPKGYYSCALAGIYPPQGRKAAYYASCLKEGQVLEHQDVAGAGLYALGDAVQGPEAFPAVLDDPDVVQELADIEPLALEDGGIGEGDSETDTSSASLSSSSSSQAGGETSNESDSDGLADIVQPGGQWPAFIDGAVVTVDDYSGPTQNYTRLVLRCRHHNGCVRKHNCGLRQSSVFGRREPVAFLAVWHAGGEGRTRSEHRDFQPSLEAMAAWLDANPA